MRRRATLIAAAAGTIFAMTLSPAVFAESEVCVGGSCEGTYLSVGLTGDAHSSSGVAVSTVGNSYTGSGVGVSALGRSDGWGTNVSGEAHVSLLTGLLEAPVNAEQAELAAQALIIYDQVGLKEKLEVLAHNAPHVVANMAMNAELPDGAAPRMRSGHVPPAIALNTPFIAQERWYYCVPSAVHMYMEAWGARGFNQDQWAGALRTNHPQQTKDKTAGTPLKNAVSIVNGNKSHRDSVYWVQAKDATQLMNLVTTDVGSYGHGVLLAIKTTSAKWWSHRGSPDTRHAILPHGYDHSRGGAFWFMDPYDFTRYGWNERSWGGPNPGGSKKKPLTEVWAAVKAAGGGMVW